MHAQSTLAYTDASPISSVDEGLTFTGVDPFDVFTDAAGSATGIDLGSFDRDNVNVSDSTPTPYFNLLVTFSSR